MSCVFLTVSHRIFYFIFFAEYGVPSRGNKIPYQDQLRAGIVYFRIHDFISHRSRISYITYAVFLLSKKLVTGLTFKKTKRIHKEMDVSITESRPSLIEKLRPLIGRQSWSNTISLLLINNY